MKTILWAVGGAAVGSAVAYYLLSQPPAVRLSLAEGTTQSAAESVLGSAIVGALS